MTRSNITVYSLGIMILGFLLFLFMTPVYAMNVTLEWDPNQEPDLAGYKIYYGTASGDYSPAGADYADEGASPVTVATVDLGDPDNPEFTLTGLTDAKVYFLVVTAYDDEGLESDPSNVVNTSGVIDITSPPTDGGGGGDRGDGGGGGGCFLDAIGF